MKPVVNPCKPRSESAGVALAQGLALQRRK